MSKSYKVVPGHKCLRGHTSERVHVGSRRCYDCHIEDNRVRRIGQRKNNRLNNPGLTLWNYARYRAKKKGIHFDLQLEDVVVPECCPCCRQPFVLGAPLGRAVPQTPSLDRFKAELGYVKENIAVICFRCNTLKRDATLEELTNVARWMNETAA